MVLVDTPVWSQAIPRAKADANPKVTNRLAELVLENTAVVLGSVRQEVLSGISTQEEFARTRVRMEVIPDFPIEPQDHVFAAQLYNTCRRAGIQGSHTDFLLCAVSIRQDMEIFTLDKDFTHYAKAIPIRLFKV